MVRKFWHDYGTGYLAFGFLHKIITLDFEVFCHIQSIVVLSTRRYFQE